ncbi:MAG TPA: hypothetical protein VGG33_23365 [Polyangia bacterium]
MDAQELEAVFRRPEDDPDVIKIFEALGITKRPKVVDNVAEIILKDRGLRLAMRPEGPKSSRLILSSLTFFSGATDNYTPFAGALPKGLVFGDNQVSARAKLGEPSDSVPEFRMDHWIFGDRRLTLKYRQADGTIHSVIIGLPT